MNKQVFAVYGDPKGKGRPRFFKGHAYTDKSTAEYEAKVKHMWSFSKHERLGKVPTAVLIDAYFRVPTSLSKAKRAELFGKQYLKKPDGDNIAKIILDALNGLAYEDDSQIATLCVTKKYVNNDDEEPRVVVTILGGGEDERSE